MVETKFPPNSPNPFASTSPIASSGSASASFDSEKAASVSLHEGKHPLTQPASKSADTRICAWLGDPDAAQADLRKPCGKPCRKPTHEHCSSTCRMRAKALRDKKNETGGTKTSIKNFFGDKINAARDLVSKIPNPFSEKPFIAASDVPNPNPFSATASPAADSIVSVAFRKAVGAGVKGTFTVANAVTRYFAERAELSEEFIVKLLKSLSPDPDALQDFVDSLDAVLKKHNWQPKNMEEWTLAINFVRLMSPYPTAIMMLAKEIKRKERGA